MRLLDYVTSDGRRYADLAIADIQPLNTHVPLWFRLRIDVTTSRIVAMRMITVGHFMNQQYNAFDVPVVIRPPRNRR